MARSVEIPGGTAVLRDVSDLRERHRRQILAAVGPLAKVYAKIPSDLIREGAEQGPEGEQARAQAELIMSGLMTRQERLAMSELRDAMICALLQSWTLPQPLPDVDTVQDLTPELYDALNSAIRGQEMDLVQRINPANFEPQPPDRDSPFGASANSATSSSTGANRSRSTRKRPRTGASSRTGESSAA